MVSIVCPSPFRTSHVDMQCLTVAVLNLMLALDTDNLCASTNGFLSFCLPMHYFTILFSLNDGCLYQTHIGFSSILYAERRNVSSCTR